MNSIAEQMLHSYVMIDDFLQHNQQFRDWRQSNNAHPKFSDSEVLTLALLQGVFGVATLKKTYLLVAVNYRRDFPNLPTYKQFINRLHQLQPQISRLLAASCVLPETVAQEYLIDGKPVPLCENVRGGRVVLMRDDGQASWGKSSTGWFFGFRLHVLQHIDGRICNAILTPANWDERDVAAALVMFVEEGEFVIGDLGYRGERAQEVVWEESALPLVTKADARAAGVRLPPVRQRIEASFSKLWHNFLDRVFSRSWRGLWNTIQLKLLFYNLQHGQVI